MTIDPSSLVDHTQKETNNSVKKNDRVEHVFRSYKIRKSVFGSLLESKSKKNQVLLF